MYACDKSTWTILAEQDVFGNEVPGSIIYKYNDERGSTSLLQLKCSFPSNKKRTGSPFDDSEGWCDRGPACVCKGAFECTIVLLSSGQTKAAPYEGVGRNVLVF